MRIHFGSRRFRFLLALALAILAPAPAFATVPQTVNYQGTLSSAGSPFNGSTSMTFRLYNVSTGGSALWTESQTVNVVNGVFAVQLGSVTTFSSASLAFDVPYFLGITVSTNSEMTPRPPLTSVPYALRAQTAEALTALRVVANGGNPSIVGGATVNTSSTAIAGTIGGGGGSGVAGAPVPDSAITLSANQISGAANASVIAGGSGNQIILNGVSQPVFATISGGQGNTNYAYFGTIAGGRSNIAGQSALNIFGSTVGGGFGNNAFGSYGTIGGGSGNQAAALAVAPGGENNLALGQYSFAAGRAANSQDALNNRHAGTFVWADSNANGASAQTFYSTAIDQFAVRARGGVSFRVVSTVDANTGAGCSLPAGGAAQWSCSSDRNLKEAVRPISPQSILQRVVDLPLSTWQFKGTTRRSMGPMSQDFWAAFGLGVDDKNITISDVSGVALGAIQGLYQMLQERDREISRLKSTEQELAALKRELGEIKSALGLR